MNNITDNNLEYKQLAEYLFFNLNKDFKRYYQAISNSETAQNTKKNAIAVGAINLLTTEEKKDRKISFITYILPELVDNGLTKKTYIENQSLVLNAYKNMMIDMYRKDRTEKKYIVHLETIYTEDGEEINPMDNIEAIVTVEDIDIDLLWENWATYVHSLPSNLKKLTIYFIPTTSFSSVKLAKELGIPDRTLRYQVEQIRKGFKLFLTKNAIEVK